MIHTILHNKYINKATLIDIKLGKNNEFFIWRFKLDSGREVVGFTPGKLYFGNKGYLWYSLLIGYFLPPSYSINFHNAIGKKCYVGIDAKGVVRSLIPLNDDGNNSQNVSPTAKPAATDTDATPPTTNTEYPPTVDTNEPSEPSSEENELFG